MNKRIFVFVLMALSAAVLTTAAPVKPPIKPSKAARKKAGHPVQATFVPNSYIVELTGDAVVPGVNKVAGAKAFSTQDKKLVAEHRARVAAEQQSMRSALQGKGAKVTGSVDVVMNAVFVYYKGARSELAAMPGVKQVYAVRKMKRTLDRATVNYQATDVWNLVGGKANAGAGMKIGILDEGIDMTSGAFVDTGFQAPPGYPIADSASDMSLLNNKVIVGRSYATQVCQDPSVATCVGSTDPDPTINDHSGHGTATASVAAGVTNACNPSTGNAELNQTGCFLLGLVIEGGQELPYLSQSPDNAAFTTPVTGAAPGAYLGVYRIWDTVNDTTTDPVIIQAINDAVSDGMDVISMSFGSIYATRFDQDPEYVPVLNAYQAGVIVVASAGNEGPGYTSIASPGTYPDIIAAGAATNDRAFGPGIWGQFVYNQYFNPTVTFADGSTPAIPVVGVAADAGLLNDVNGNNDVYACNTFPAGSLAGTIAFISRGPEGSGCSFATKLNNAQAAGAVGAIVYDYEDDADNCYDEYGDPLPYLYCVPGGPYNGTASVGSATLPAQLMDFYSAQNLLYEIDLGYPITLSMGFTATFEVPVNLLTLFSSTGPNVDLSIKPDVVAIGQNVAMDTQAQFYPGDSYGSVADLFDPSGYIVADGTSFASPFTAGVAAMMKAAHPGLTLDQYRSLIVNSAKGMLDSNGNLYSTQQIGGGLLNALNAYNSPATVCVGAQCASGQSSCLSDPISGTPITPVNGSCPGQPLNIGLGSSSSNPTVTQSITLTNLGSATDSYTFSVASTDGVLQPIVPSGPVQIPAGQQSQPISITFAASGLPGGPYQGAIIATSAATGAKISVPYWLDVASNTPASLFSLCSADQSCTTDWVAGQTYLGAFDFRVLDAAGAPITNFTPTVTVVSGAGQVLAVNSADAPNAGVIEGDPQSLFGAGTYTIQDIPGLWTVDVKLDPTVGGNGYNVNVFQVNAGSVSLQFTIYGCTLNVLNYYGYCGE